MVRKFAKGEGGGELGVFFKRGGAAVGSVRGSTGRQCFKISLVNLRRGGGVRLTQGGVTTPPPP